MAPTPRRDEQFHDAVDEQVQEQVVQVHRDFATIQHQTAQWIRSDQLHLLDGALVDSADFGEGKVSGTSEFEKRPVSPELVQNYT